MKHISASERWCGRWDLNPQGNIIHRSLRPCLLYTSMKLDKRFHCFGCGADGDVIDFVAALYGLGKKEAAEMCIRDSPYITSGASETIKLEKGKWYSVETGEGLTMSLVNVRIE